MFTFFSFVCLNIDFLHKRVFELEWRMVLAQLLCCWLHWYEPGVAWGDYKTVRLKHETIGLALSCLQMNEQEYVSKLEPDSANNCWFIHRWQKCRPTAMATTEVPGGPHRDHAGKLTNSMVNWSTSGKPAETHDAGLACRVYPGKRGVSRSRTKGHKLDFFGGNKLPFVK